MTMPQFTAEASLYIPERRPGPITKTTHEELTCVRKCETPVPV